MSPDISPQRRDGLDYRVAEVVAYVADRFVTEHPGAPAAATMKRIYHSKRYQQLADYSTYLYTFTFDELYQMFLSELEDQYGQPLLPE
jgi:hypothetical protein